MSISQMEKDKALFAAIRSGDCNALESLLDQGADVNTYDESDNTPLIAALRLRRNDVAMRLIERNADVNKTTDGNHYSPYCFADVEMIPRLKSHGGDPNLLSASFGGALAVALHSHTEDLEARVQALIRAGADATEPKVLLYAVRGDRDRRSHLPFAALRLLLDAGMPVDRVNDGGKDPHWISPLEIALSEHWRLPLFLPLLQAGAPLNHAGMLQALAMHPFEGYGCYADQALAQGLSINSRHFQSSDTALHVAAQRDDLAWLEFFLSHAPDLELLSLVNFREETALGSAVRANAMKAAQRLLEAGADPNSRLDDSTLVDWSADNRAMHRMLTKAGAKSEQAPKRLSKLEKLWGDCHEAEGPEQQVMAFDVFLRAAELDPAWMDLDGALTRARACQDARWTMLELTEALLPTRSTAIDRDSDELSADFYRDLVQELAGLGGPTVDKVKCKATKNACVLSFEALGQTQQWSLNPVQEGFDPGFWNEADELLKSRDKNLRYWRMQYDSIELVCCVPRKLAKLWEADPIR